jgi:FkbM family methyltransferase
MMHLPKSVLLPYRLQETARVTRRLLKDAPVPDGWMRDAVNAQVRMTAGAVRHLDDGLVRTRVGSFDVTGFSVKSVATLHREIFVDLSYYFCAQRPDPLILDGGSNIGMSVLFFKALYPKARVFAFEPAEPAHRLLLGNVERNRLVGVEVHHAALGRENGPVAFFDDAHDLSTFGTSTRRERLPNPRKSTVSQRRLSDFIEESVDLVKLDIEGAEDEVLDDLIDSGAIRRIDQLVVEYHHLINPSRDFVGAFLERLRAEGFLYQISARERIFRRTGRALSFQDVLVFARRPPAGSS